jgi:hypothetical protein
MKKLHHDYCLNRQRNPFTHTYNKNRKKEHLISRVRVVAVIVLILILSLGWWIFLSNFFKITAIDISGLQRLPLSEVKNAANDDTNGFLKGNLLLLNKKSLAADLRLRFNLKDATISKVWPHGLKISLTERDCAWFWQESDNFWWIDNEGYVIDSGTLAPIAASTTPASTTMAVISLSVSTSTAGILPDINVCRERSYPIIENNSVPAYVESLKQIRIDASLKKSLDYLVSDLKKQEYSPLRLKKLILDKFNAVKIEFVSGLDVSFNIKDDLGKQLANLLTLKKANADLANWKEIDLRYGDKIYYQK